MRARLAATALVVALALAPWWVRAVPYNYGTRGDFFTAATAAPRSGDFFVLTRGQVAWIEVVGTGTFDVQCDQRLLQEGGSWVPFATISANELRRVPGEGDADHGPGFLRCDVATCTGCNVSARWWVMPGAGAPPTTTTTLPFYVQETERIPDHSSPHASAYIGGKLFVLTEEMPAALIRFETPLTDLGPREVLTFPNDGLHGLGISMVYDSGTGKLYATFADPSRVVVSRVDPVSLVWSDVISDAGAITGQGWIDTDGTYLYVTAYSSAKLRQYRLSDFGLQSTLNTTKGTPHGIRYSGGKVYVSGAATPAWLGRYAVTPLALEEIVDLPAGENAGVEDLFVRGTQVFTGAEASATGNIYAYTAASLATAPTAIPIAGSAGTFGVFDLEGWIWTAVKGSPGKLGKTNPTGFATTVTGLDSGLNQPATIASDGAGHLWVAFFSDVLRVLRIGLTP